MGHSPVYDEPALRGKSRDELVVLACDLSVRVVHLEQVLEQKQASAPPEGASLTAAGAELAARDARIAVLEADLAKSRAELDEATSPKRVEGKGKTGK